MMPRLWLRRHARAQMVRFEDRGFHRSMVVAIATFVLTGVAPRMRLFISQTLPERLDSMAGPTSSRGKWVDTRYQLRVSHVRRPR